MFLISFANILPRLASTTAFLCFVVAHLEWPDIGRPFRARWPLAARGRARGGTGRYATAPPRPAYPRAPAAPTPGGGRLRRGQRAGTGAAGAPSAPSTPSRKAARSAVARAQAPDVSSPTARTTTPQPATTSHAPWAAATKPAAAE